MSDAPPTDSSSMTPTVIPTSPSSKAATKKSTSSTLGTMLLIGLVALVLVGIWRGWFNNLGEEGGFNWQALQPELITVLFAVLLPLVNLGNVDRRGVRQFALFGLAGAFVMTALSMSPAGFNVLGREIGWNALGETVYGVYGITFASQLLKLVFLGSAFLAILGMGRPLKGRAEDDTGEFLGLVLFAVLGMMVVVSSKELITLVLGIEMASMSSYLMAGMRRDAAGAESSLKYFTMGAIASSLMLFGVSLLYGMAGSTKVTDIAAAVTAHGTFDVPLLIPVAFFVAGLGFKISSIPFQAWAPDVYAGAPAPVAGLLASGSKAMGMVAVFTVFLGALPGAKANWELLLAVVATASMFYGNLLALQQTSIRRMLAYSSIAQAGYLLIAVVVGTSAQDGGVYAVGGGVLHLIVNAAMKLGAFIAVGALLLAGVPDQVEDWKGLGRRAPLLGFAMVIFMLSMAGLPPLGGFQSKFVLFGAAVDAAATERLGWLLFLAVAGVVNSAISLYYYLRVMRTMYVDEGKEGRIEVPLGAKAAVVLCAILVLVIGFYPQPFLDASFHAAKDILGLNVVAAAP